MANNEILLMAHLMRRVGFGSTKDELNKYVKKGYDNQVDEILDLEPNYEVSNHMINRYQPDYESPMGSSANGATWLYRMVWSDFPFKEKISLFWHGIFATGYPKVVNSKPLSDQIRMFRRYSMGNFNTLLLQMAKDPAMIIWLDNQQNHKDAINENFGRELLELFSMGFFDG